MRTRQASKEQPMRTDVYQKITDRIVSELEQGVRPYMTNSPTVSWAMLYIATARYWIKFVHAA
jgi:hypothetical protein